MLARGSATCPSPGILHGPAVCIAFLPPSSVEDNRLPPSVGASDPLNCAPAHPPGAAWAGAGGAEGVSGVELLSSFNLSQPPGQGGAASENGNSCAGEDADAFEGAGKGTGKGAGEGTGGDGAGGLGADWPFSLAQPPILLAGGGGLPRLRGGGPGPSSSPPSSTEGGGFGLMTDFSRLFVSFDSDFFSGSSGFSGGLSTLSTRRGLGTAGSGAAADFSIPQPDIIIISQPDSQTHEKARKQASVMIFSQGPCSAHGVAFAQKQFIEV